MSAPLLVAHRGAPVAGVPENSLRAFREAAAAGAAGVELDVRRTRDGGAVVFHDPRVRLPGGRTVPVASLFEAEMRALPLGAGETAPSLEEALGLLIEQGLGVLVEIKDAGAEEAVARAVRALRAERRLPWLVVGSFLPSTVRRFARARPGVRRALILARGALFPVASMGRCRAHDLMPHFSLVKPALVARVARRRGRVYAWTVNAPARARRVAAAGVHGVITDRLREVAEALYG